MVYNNIVITCKSSAAAARPLLVFVQVKNTGIGFETESNIQE